MCPNCRAFITTDDKVCPYCQAQVGERAIERRAPADVLGGLIPHQRFVTMLIMLVNTGMYVAMMLRTTQQGGSGFGDPSLQTLVDFGAKYAPYIFGRGEWWRLITAAFLHGGLLHIGMNFWVLYDLGPQVNEAFGTPRFLSIYLVSSVTGFLASLYWSPAVSIGASAGLCGLIGAMIALGTRARSAVGRRDPPPVHPLGDLFADLRTDHPERGQFRSRGRAGGRVRAGLCGGNARFLRGRGKLLAHGGGPVPGGHRVGVLRDVHAPDHKAT